jgi:hypothetical protein
MYKALALVLFSLVARTGVACSCAETNHVCAAYWGTSVLFLGHVVRIEHSPGQLVVHFEITKSYRGTSGQSLIVRTPDQGPACGYTFSLGHDYLVYGYAAANGGVETNHCTRTHEVTSQAGDPDLQWLEALPKAPHGSSIFGRVWIADAPTVQANIAVSIAGPESKRVLTDSEGKFQAAGVKPGKYVVSATTPRRYQGFPDRTVTVEDRGCAEVNWSTRLDGHIRGHLYFVDGSTAAGVYLSALGNYATTNSDGSFDFAGLPPGSYDLAVNRDFAPQDANSYYRRVVFPNVIAIGPGETVDQLKFFLPADSQPPSVPLQVTVLGFDGKPVPQAQVLAYDDMWLNSVTPLMAETDGGGVAALTLRPGSQYDIEAFVNLPDFTQACAEPVRVDAAGHPAPLLLVLKHPFGNCMQFRKPLPPGR